MPAPVAFLLTVLVAMLALGPVTPATTVSSTVLSGAVTFVGLVDTDRPDTPSEDAADDLLTQLLSQVQQVQEEEEDLHTRELISLALPAVSAHPRAVGRLVSASDDMSPRLSRPPRA
jgi:hypothetical protein